MDELHTRYAGILGYLAEYLPEDPVFDWLLAESQRRGFPAIQVSPEQGRLLALLVQLLGARRVLEVGTLAGYSAIWMARALLPDGRLTTLEANPAHAALAREALQRADVADRVTLVEGPALETLARLDGEASFDMAFIDADKPNNRAYFDWARQHVRGGGLVVVDNVLANGRVADPSVHTPGSYGHTVHAFNQHVFGDCAPCSAVLPFYRADRKELDGMLVYRIPSEESPPTGPQGG